MCDWQLNSWLEFGGDADVTIFTGIFAFAGEGEL